MGETGDGFMIAEADLEIRGPGELLGAKQSGLPKLRFGDLHRHNQLLRLARAEAETVLADDPILARPEHHRLRQTLAGLEDASVFGPESG